MTSTTQTRETVHGSHQVTLRDLRVETAAGVPIVDGISLSLAAGEILGVVGESGSGKTTTALSLFGVTQGGARLRRGTVSFQGRPGFDLTEPASLRALRGRHLSYVPQSPGTSLNPVMRVGRALAEMQRKRNTYDAAARRDLEAERTDMLEVVGLPGGGEFQRRFPHQLSGGQQQRVCLAVALLSGAGTIVLDEPTTGLDVITQAAVLSELARLRSERDVSMIYISHDLAVVAHLATTVAVMYAGRIVEVGATERVLNRPTHPYTRGLLDSTPDHRSTVRVQAMPGTAATLGDRVENSCSFAPRCDLRDGDCLTSEPLLRPLTDGAGDVSCHHPITDGVRGPRPAQVEATRTWEDVVLRVEGLTVEHRVRGRKVAAVDRVSLEIGRGECLALVGESGSGKTTIARAIAGLQAYETGSIELHGTPLATTSARRTKEQRRLLQIVFQNSSLAINPRENVRAAIGRSLMTTAPAARKSLDELLELVRLPVGLADRLPRELSGGERQRVAIARALAANPELIVCDEITSALDVSVQAAVLSLLHELRRELGLSLLFITHDLGVVSDLADRIAVLRDGSVCETGRTRSVLDNPNSPYARALMEAAPSLGAT